ncbi:MAG TPA: hypothetical protein DCE56_45470 [Cyanobacteria bacterium UBA8553]|nr:hypothetical protein [Cyanobacteria bacterium UBA8553]HAJ62987.1 hypothetical protein [Cyanobacteria bacterium UBA8543]
MLNRSKIGAILDQFNSGEPDRETAQTKQTPAPRQHAWWQRKFKQSNSRYEIPQQRQTPAPHIDDWRRLEGGSMYNNLNQLR